MRKYLWPAYVVALCTWGILSYESLIEWFGDGSLFAQYRDGRPYVSDFVNVYNAGLLTKRAFQEHINIYDPAIQDASARELVKPVVPEQPFNLQYPPYFFVLMLPLAVLSFKNAWIAWVLFYGVLTAISVRWLSADIASRKERLTVVALFFASYPVWLSFKLGQTSLPEFNLFCAFFWALQNSRLFLSGAVSALATIKLQYTPYLGVCGLLGGGWKFLLGGIAGIIGLLAGATSVLGEKNVVGYAEALIHGEFGHDVSGVGAQEMQNVRGALALLLGGDTTAAHITALAAMVVAGLFLLWLWWRARGQLPQNQRAFKLLAAVTVLTAVTTSVHTHAQDYILAGIACIWVWQMCDESTREGLWTRRLIAFAPLVGWVHLVGRPLFSLLKVQLLFLWALALLLLIARLTMREIRLHGEDPSPGEAQAENGGGDSPNE